MWDDRYNQFPVADWGSRWEIKIMWLGSAITPRLSQLLRFGRPSATRISRKSEFSMHLFNNVRLYKKKCCRNPASTHLNVIDGSMTALLASILRPPPCALFLRARKNLARVSKMLFYFFLLLEELRVWNCVTWNCVIHGQSVLCYCVQCMAELVFHPFIAGLKTKTEGMEYLLFQASIPLIWARFHLIFITSIIAVEVLGCLVRRICRRWTVVIRW